MDKNILALLIGGGALLAWSLSRADDQPVLTGNGNGGNGGELPDLTVPTVPPAGTNTSQVPLPYDAGLGPETLPGAPQCSPCSGATPFTPIPPGGAPCAGCAPAPILPPPFHFMVGSPLPLPGYWSIPAPGYAV
jgi:hypothetical protein